jgi:hypothetical protein
LHLRSRSEKTQFRNGQGNSPPEEKKPIIVYQLPAPGISDAGKIKTVGLRATTEMCSGSRPRKMATA